jgi:hypothetical protein
VPLVVVVVSGQRPSVRQLEIALSTFERLDRWLLAVLEARVFDTTQMTIAFLGGAI